MKTLLKFLTVVTTATIVITACNKQKEVSPSENATATTAVSNNSLSKTTPPKNPPNAHVQRLGASAGWCSYPPAISCIYLKEVIIKANAVRLNALNGASSSAVAAAFNSSELISVTQNLSDEYLGKLRSGNYYIKTQNSSATKVSYIVGTVLPVTMENFEFAFQFDITN